MKKIIGLILSIFLSLICLAPAAADNLTNAFSAPLNTAANSATYKTGSSAATPEDIISGGINIALSLLGSIFLILIVYAGIKWMLAGGEEETIKKSKNTIRNAMIGLVITLAAYALSYFIMAALMAGTKLGPGASQ